MNPQTKRSLCIGVFLVVLTLVVLYSYCNGNSVCYTFPFLGGLGQNRVVKPEAEMVVTSVIVQTKGPLQVQIPHKGKSKENHSKPTVSQQHNEQDMKTDTNVNHKNMRIHGDQNITSHEVQNVPSHDVQNVDRTRATENHQSKTRLLPPSDIVGKVAEEILRKANVSEEQANRELFRVEKVDENMDKYEGSRRKEHREEKMDHKPSIIQKIKEDRSTGAKKSDQRLVRVERVDLTDEDEDEVPVKPVIRHVESGSEIHPSTDSSLKLDSVKHLQTGNEAKSWSQYASAKTNDSVANTSETKSPFNARESQTQNVESAASTLNLQNNNSPQVTDKPSQFFRQFLNFTKEERNMVDSLINFHLNKTTSNFSQSVNSLQLENGTEWINKETSKNIPPPSANAEKDDSREKRDFEESEDENPSLGLPELLASLLNITGHRETTKHDSKSSLKDQKNPSQLKGPLNLGNVLRKIANERNEMVERNYETTTVPDSTALLVKFLTQGKRYRPRMPHSDTAADKGEGGSGRASGNTTRLETKGRLATDAPINLKNAIMELTNHMNFTDNIMGNNNGSHLSFANSNSLDLHILRVLSRESASQLNLTRVLKEIAGDSFKSNLAALRPIKGQPVKRDESEEELGSTHIQPDIEIFEPAVDKLGTRRPVTVFRTEKKPFVTETDSVTSERHEESLTSRGGSGSGESGLKDSESLTDSERRKISNLPTWKKSDKRQRSKPATNGILKFTKITCEPLDPKILLYNRIFKTGSSTTESLIMNSSSSLHYDYKIGTTEDWYENGESGPYPGLIIRKANKKLKKFPRMAFVAHFYFRQRLNLPQAHTYINQVRQPIRRVVSHYFYMRSSNRPSSRIRQFLTSKERNESLGQCFTLKHKGCQNNVITRFFCGKHSYCRRGNGRALKKAINNIQRYYAVIGLLENYEVYLQILHKRLPHFFPQVSRSAIGRAKYNPDYSFDSVPQDLIESITRANWADMKLYSFITERFWQQAKACGITDIPT